MLLNAKQILVSELVLAEQKELTEIESMVENKINASYADHMASLEQNTIEENVVKKIYTIKLNNILRINEKRGYTSFFPYKEYKNFK